MRYTLLHFFVLVFCLNVKATSQNDSTIIALWEKTNYYLQQEVEDSSLFFQKKLLDHCINNDDLSSWLKYNKKVARHYRDTKKDFNYTTEVFKKTSDNIFRKPQTPRETESLGWFYADYAYTHWMKGDFLNALKNYELASNLFSNTSKNESKNVANYIYKEIGNIYTRLGDYPKALFYIQKVLQINHKAEDYNRVAKAYGDIAIIYRSQGLINEAIDMTLKGISTPNLSIPIKNHLFINISYNYLNNIHPKFKLSEIYISKAIQTLKEIKDQQLYPTYNERLIIIAEIQGKLKQLKKQHQQAIAHYQQAYDLMYEVYGTYNRREPAKVLNNIGDNYQALGDYKQALVHYQRALGAIILDFDASNYQHNPPASAIYPENTILEALEGKARAFEHLYQKENNQDQLKKALECQELIFEVEKQLRNTYQQESSKLYLQSESRQRSEKAIDLAYQLYSLTQNTIYIEKAFAIAERSKAVVLLESLRELITKNNIGIPDSLLAQERETYKQWNFINNQLLQEQLKGTKADSTTLAQRREDLFKIEQQQAQLKKIFTDNFPAYAQQIQDWQPISIPQLQAQLKKHNQSLIEYFQGEQALYSIFVEGHQMQFNKQAHTPKIAATLENMLDTLLHQRLQTNNELNLYKQQAYSLYQHLIEPHPISNKRLIIVADDALSYLPFECLLSDTNKKNIHQLPYLFQKYAISYAYSATVLRASKNKQKNPKKQCLILAPESFDYDKNLTDLTYSQEIIKGIEALLNTDPLINNAATKNAFLTKAADYDVLHLSTHAGLGLAPWIAFRDQKLYLPEIYSLELNANLVVLGACETGRGKLERGEGAMSLARGFAYTGVGSTLMSLWKVNEQTTNDLMLCFYKNLQKGMTKDNALQQARTNYLENCDPKYSTPYDWAGFVLIGDTVALKTNTNYNYLIGVIGLIALFLGAMLLKQKL